MDEEFNLNQRSTTKLSASSHNLTFFRLSGIFYLSVDKQSHCIAAKTPTCLGLTMSLHAYLLSGINTWVVIIELLLFLKGAIFCQFLVRLLNQWTDLCSY